MKEKQNFTSYELYKEREDMTAEDFINNLRRFFYGLALLSFVTALFLLYVRSCIYGEQNQAGSFVEEVLFNRFIECGIKVFAVLPILILNYHYQKKFSSKQYSWAGVLVSVITFFYIIWGMIMPFVVTAMTSSYEITDLLIIFSGCFCMFFIGQIGKIKLLKRCAYIFVAIPVLLLGTKSVIEIYYQYSNTSTTLVFTAEFVYVVTLLRSLWNIVCPAICYLLIALQLKNGLSKADGNFFIPIQRR